MAEGRIISESNRDIEVDVGDGRDQARSHLLKPRVQYGNFHLVQVVEPLGPGGKRSLQLTILDLSELSHSEEHVQGGCAHAGRRTPHNRADEVGRFRDYVRGRIRSGELKQSLSCLSFQPETVTGQSK